MIRKFSQTGKYHLSKNIENQDCLFSGSNERFTVIALTDGVSSCLYAKAGAEITCRAVSDLFLNKGDYFLEFTPEKTADFVVSHILYQLQERAELEKQAVQEYSSTVACALLDRESGEVLLLNLGDGLILGVSNGKCLVLSAPFDSSEGGCCVTTTRHAEKMTDVRFTDGRYLDQIMICTDGAWKQMISRGKMKAEVKDLLTSDQTDELGDYLKCQDCFDDCSFVSMDMEIEGETKWETVFG